MYGLEPYIADRSSYASRVSAQSISSGPVSSVVVSHASINPVDRSAKVSIIQALWLAKTPRPAEVLGHMVIPGCRISSTTGSLAWIWLLLCHCGSLLVGLVSSHIASLLIRLVSSHIARLLVRLVRRIHAGMLRIELSS